MHHTHNQSSRLQDPLFGQLVRTVQTLAGMMLIASSVVAKTGVSAERPGYDVVSMTVTDHFASLKDYRPGDLVNQSQVADALSAVESAGWAVLDPDAIIKLAPADNSFLVQVLSTTSGRRFMRQIAKNPGA